MREFLRDSDFSQEQFPTLELTLNAARLPNYYFCNAFLLVFLITISGLSTFSISCDRNQNRIQTTCKLKVKIYNAINDLLFQYFNTSFTLIGTLILTSVTFKWITNRSLPAVSYMTSLDKYSLTCILFLVVSLMWHSSIGQIAHLKNANLQLVMYYDQVSFLLFFCLFATIQLIYLLWLVIFGYAQRRALDREEKKYTDAMNENKGRSTRLKSMLYGI